ncbi:MAG: hypothetical protein GF364_05215 [Candidatus Lokiarchaeota archaeon]|nr:hypothetical protein [Candidatus Lokiarchaeota archaeon]
MSEQNLSVVQILSPLIAIGMCFASFMGALWPFIAQCGVFLEDADFVIAGITGVSSFFFQKIVHKNNEKIISLILNLSISSAALLCITYFLVPNYSISDLPTNEIKWLGGLDSHPFAWLYLMLIFCFTNGALLCIKIFGRLNYNRVKKSHDYLILWISMGGSIIIGGISTSIAQNIGWVMFMPSVAVSIAISATVLNYLYRRKKQFFQDLLLEPKTLPELDQSQYIFQNLKNDIFLLFALIISFTSVIYMIPVTKSRKQAALIYGDVYITSIIFFAVFIVIYFIYARKLDKILWIEVSSIIIVFGLIVPLVFFIPWETATPAHTLPYNMLVGISFSSSLLALSTISINRLHRNHGSSWFIDLIWIGIPYLVSVIADMSFGSSDLGEFIIMFLILTIIPIILTLIQIYLLKSEFKAFKKINDAKKVVKSNIRTEEDI